VCRFFVPFEPEVDWFTFAATIVSALVCLALWVYQRYVGLRSGSLAFITQSVDSRNHVIVAASVTAGLIGSLLTRLKTPRLADAPGRFFVLHLCEQEHG